MFGGCWTCTWTQERRRRGSRSRTERSLLTQRERVVQKTPASLMAGLYSTVYSPERRRFPGEHIAVLSLYVLFLRKGHHCWVPLDNIE